MDDDERVAVCSHEEDAAVLRWLNAEAAQVVANVVDWNERREGGEVFGGEADHDCSPVDLAMAARRSSMARRTERS